MFLCMVMALAKAGGCRKSIKSDLNIRAENLKSSDSSNCVSLRNFELVNMVIY